MFFAATPYSAASLRALSGEPLTSATSRECWQSRMRGMIWRVA
jgi:hypothetical protein